KPTPLSGRVEAPRARSLPGPQVTLAPMQGRAQSLPQVLRLLGAFVVTAVAMGLLMAGLAMPAVGASGAAANSSIAAFEELPSDFTASPLSQQSVILDADGGVIATPYDENRIIVPLAQIAPILQQAV